MSFGCSVVDETQSVRRGGRVMLVNGETMSHVTLRSARQRLCSEGSVVAFTQLDF